MSSRTSRECPVNPLAGFHDSTLSNLHGAGMEQRAKGGLDEISTKHRGSRPVVIHHFLYGRVWWRGGGGNNSSPVPLAPTVVTSKVNTPSVDTALINGSVNPNGLEATAWFEYGTDSSLTNPTRIANQVMAAATVPQAINGTLASLSAGTK